MRLLSAGVLAMCVAAGCREPPPPPATTPTEAEATAPAAAALPKRPLRLGRVPHLRVDATRTESTPLVTYLSERFSHPFELVVASSYDEAVDQAVRGEVDVAVLSPLAYVVAKQRLPELEILAQIVAEGGADYLGYIVVPADSPRRALSDLRGARFAFVDPQSASGYLLAVDLLARAGLDPKRDFASARFVGSHPDVVQAVLGGRADAGAIASTTFGHMRDGTVSRRLRILAKSEPIPFDAVVAHPSLPAEFKRELKAVILALSSRTAEGRVALSNSKLSNGFVPGDDAAYARVRAVAEQLGLLR